MNNIILHKDYAQIEIISEKHGNKCALIDIEDVEKVKDYNWFLFYNKKNNKFIAYTKINRKMVKLQKIIVNNFKIGYFINGNTLDVRKANLHPRGVHTTFNILQSYINCYHKSGCCEYCQILSDYPSLQQNKGKCHTWETVIKLLEKGVDFNNLNPVEDKFNKMKGEIK
jgi:hypothetical protein